MVQHKRYQYLEAMGIQTWHSRHPLDEPSQPQPIVDEAPVQQAPAPDADSSPVATPADAGLDWPELEATIKGCTRCELHKSRTQAVPGVGNHNADWMVIGEAPGADEDRVGEPFVGRAGKLLDQMLLAMKLKREQVYIANIVKCRPPNNRDPAPEEAAACEGYLKRQIELVQPKVILAVGRVAAHNLLQTDQRVGALRGKRLEYAGTGIPVVVTYHPAYLLRSPGEKRKAWQDLLLAQRVMQDTD